MKILLSVFACAPTGGSELGGGWNWAMELAREHEVVALTDIARRSAIEAAHAECPLPANLRFVFFRPLGLGRVPLNSWTANLLYSAWQYTLLPTARHLHRAERFDLAIHLTYGVFRTPSFLGFLRIPFVFGPVGGGEDSPFCLRQSMPLLAQLRELFRTVLIAVSRWNPLLRLALGKASVIFVRTNATRAALPLHLWGRCLQFQEIGTNVFDAGNSISLSQRDAGAPLELLIVTRLLPWKGVQFAMRALAETLRRGTAARLTIVGKGPYLRWLQRVEHRLGLSGHINWIGHIPQNVLLSSYRNYHAFIFPSLHDSGGNVVLEALAGGLPVICLDLGGPATLVDDACSLIVHTKGLDEKSLSQSIADTICILASDEPRRMTMGQAALHRASTFKWQGRIGGAMALIRERITL